MKKYKSVGFQDVDGRYQEVFVRDYDSETYSATFSEKEIELTTRNSPLGRRGEPAPPRHTTVTFNKKAVEWLRRQLKLQLEEAKADE